VSFDTLARMADFGPIELWPGVLTPNRRYAPFRTQWRSTVHLLARELDMLVAKRVVIQVAIEPRDFRLDGMPRANARQIHPGVIVSFDSKWGPLEYATDEFTDWQDNIRAIALSMEALRKVDRYGVSKRGEQYRGWKQLPTGTMPDLADTITSKAQAKAFLTEHGGFREAVKTFHPDNGGDVVLYRATIRAQEILDG
jgi:hypothetical protein